MSPLSAIILLLLLLLIFLGSRRWAILGFVAGILYLTQGASVDLLGLNLYAHRFLELAGIIRIILRKEFRLISLNKIDIIFLFLYLYAAIVFVLRSSQGWIFHIGSAVDALFTYFTFRGLITSIEDFKWFLKRLTFLIVPFTLLALIEMLTRQNPFFLVGANSWVASYREGIPRCTASFRHAILFGSFGASFFPFYIGYLLESKNKTTPIIGALACIGIVGLSNSGGPLSALVIGLIGWCLWQFRNKMYLVKFGILFVLSFIALFMKAPIWALPFKVSQITGGGGWHRYWLLEMAIQSFHKWWLAGMPMEETIDWFPYTLDATGGADITNQFVAFGITAGIITVVLFILLLIKGFKVVGKALSTPNITGEMNHQYFIWGCGVMLVVHISNWFGVTYFDQMKLVWYMQIALIAMLADRVKKHTVG